ncbi:type IV pilus modification protein PilV [Marinobacter halophilus]|uniref:Type IV pilus modification protein PilV n=1 Tax=Marinobacter halophilus TaxID=1323740 RepID=A0A2T1KGF1_9GAMM|nr:type IV pilus modification protein PilV [Marinobacter halophilus]PSF09206.1 type IV pilus modification protein PilV [Marinobacter halophilus]GGC82688.1 hypothetical protein GCM10011362_33960 [Marinobacter halophilus]
MTSKQSGITMIEVLVALLVLAVGLLGVAGMQTISMQQTQGADQRSIAVLHVQTMADEVRSNRGLPSAAERLAWETAVEKSLGDEATAKVESVIADQDVRITVTWESRQTVWDGVEEANGEQSENSMYKNSFSLLVRYAL